MIDNSPNIDRLIMIVQAAAGETVPDMGHPRTREEVFCSRALGLSWWPAITPLTGVEYCAAVAAGDIPRGDYVPKTAVEYYLLRIRDAAILPVFPPRNRYEMALAALTGVVSKGYQTIPPYTYPVTRWESVLYNYISLRAPYRYIYILSNPTSIPEYATAKIDYLGAGCWHISGILDQDLRLDFADVDHPLSGSSLYFRNYGTTGIEWVFYNKGSRIFSRTPEADNFYLNWTGVTPDTLRASIMLRSVSGPIPIDLYFQMVQTPTTALLAREPDDDVRDEVTP